MTPEPTPQPPVAPTRLHTFTHMGRVFDDPFAWMENRADPALLPWLADENAYTDAILAEQKPLQDELAGEFRARMLEDNESTPVRHGPWFYFARVAKGESYRRLYRRAVPTLENPEPVDELLIDENQLAQGLAYCRILRAVPSPDHTRLAWLVDTTGSWVFQVWVREVASGQLLAGPVEDAGYSLAWSADGSSLFCTRFDHAHRAAEVLRLDLGGEDPCRPVSVYHEEDEAFHLSVDATRSGGWITVTAKSSTTSEVLVLRADRPRDPFAVVAPRRHWHEYYVEHLPGPDTAGTAAGGHFLIRTNDAGRNFRVVRAAVEAPAEASWEEVLPVRPETLVEDVHAFRHFVALEERSGGLQRIRLLKTDGELMGTVHFPEEVYTYSLGEPQFQSGFDQNPDFESGSLRLFYGSMVTPWSTVDYHISAHGTPDAWQVLKSVPVPGYDPSDYETYRLWARSHDGAQVPVSVMHRRGLARDGSNPVLLYGYGAYGYSSDADFYARWLSLAERGFVLAIAHVRGGSELGRDWYEQGRLLHKANTFHDFIAAAEALIDQGYTRAGKIAIMGGSAGGLLMGVVTNWRPELWSAVVARVPFTNVITAMLKPDLPLTIIEWEQWGNPSIPDEFEAMLAYSPYENIRPQRYPPLLVKAGLTDLQVPWWDPSKYVARLRHTETGGAPLLLRMNMGAGHSGASDRYAKIAEDAEMYAFLIAHTLSD